MSREHHWWPVALQRYWENRAGEVSWIDPSGQITRKKVQNRKIAKKARGHRYLKGNVFEYCFEPDFSDADNSIHEVMARLRDLKPLSWATSEIFTLLRASFNNNRDLSSLSKFYTLNKKTHRQLLVLIFSLLLRSPACRDKFENYPAIFGLPKNDDIGKINMSQYYKTVCDLVERSRLSNQFFVIIRSPWKEFIFADGLLDGISDNLFANRINGRALVPLSPEICVYFCATSRMASGSNVATFTAARWQVNWINDLMQIYAKNHLFFRSRPPKLTEEFKRKQFLQLEYHRDELIDELDKLAGVERGPDYSNWPVSSRLT